MQKLLISFGNADKLAYLKHYLRSFPMAWGVPQQIDKPHESILSQYARETKHLTLKDLESYLILDG